MLWPTKDGWRSTLFQYLTCSSRLHACAAEVGNQSCVPLAQTDHSYFEVW